MILVDTSVCIAHFRTPNSSFVKLINRGQVLLHLLLLGELACGNLKNRNSFFATLKTFPLAVPASHEEVMSLLHGHKLYGLGWIDLHLLTSALLSHAQLWTLDTRLAKSATDFAIAYP